MFDAAKLHYALFLELGERVETAIYHENCTARSTRKFAIALRSR